MRYTHAPAVVCDTPHAPAVVCAIPHAPAVVCAVPLRPLWSAPELTLMARSARLVASLSMERSPGYFSGCWCPRAPFVGRVPFCVFTHPRSLMCLLRARASSCMWLWHYWCRDSGHVGHFNARAHTRHLMRHFCLNNRAKIRLYEGIPLKIKKDATGFEPGVPARHPVALTTTPTSRLF